MATHETNQDCRWQLSYVPDIFQHSQQPVGPESGYRATTEPGLGILSRQYPTDSAPESDQSVSAWERLDRYLTHLNSESKDVQYKVLYVARHGEGNHNVKERQVGRLEWERHWSHLDGDETMNWADAPLTVRGREQADGLRTFWGNAMASTKVPAPEKYFVSPLTRCLETAQATFGKLDLSERRPFRPIVKDSLREIFGVHTCDRRRSRTEIESGFPEFYVEPGFAESDELWKSDKRETFDEAISRLEVFLQKMFMDETATYISVTSHSGAIRALQAAVGHPDVWTGASAVVPILVRAERV